MPWAQPPGKRVGTPNRLTPYKDHPRRDTKGQKRNPRRGTKDHEGTRRQMDLLQPQAAPKCFGNLVTMSWDEGFPGARASRPHQAWHSPGHLPHLDQPGTAPWLSFGLADGVRADRVAACSIALKLSGGQRDRMRAGRPRSQAMPSRRCRGGCLAGDFSESRRAPFGKLPFAREPHPRPAVRIIRGKTADR